MLVLVFLSIPFVLIYYKYTYEHFYSCFIISDYFIVIKKHHSCSLDIYFYCFLLYKIYFNYVSASKYYAFDGFYSPFSFENFSLWSFHFISIYPCKSSLTLFYGFAQGAGNPNDARPEIMAADMEVCNGTYPGP